MHFHLERHFPGNAGALERLANKSRGFESLLADYEELRTWLAVREQQGPVDRDELRSARELIGELEDEIRQQLERQAVQEP